MPKNYVDKENAVFRVETSTLKGPLNKYRLTIKCLYWAGTEVYASRDKS